jgi:archaellum biogenesis protein FlaJ (TadC family)
VSNSEIFFAGLFLADAVALLALVIACALLWLFSLLERLPESEVWHLSDRGQSALFWVVKWCVIALGIQLAAFALFVIGHVLVDLVNNVTSAANWPYYFAGFTGFALLTVSIFKKNAIVGSLGAALIAAAFSHWVGPITFPK